ncbi:IKI3 family-domain-containing protein, partial [Dimargaris cristalligena]
PLPVSTLARLVGLHYLTELDTLFMAFDQGEILLLRDASAFDPAAHGPENLDPVGDFEDGILAVAWSPDDEILVVITGRHNVLLMTKDFDVLAEFNIFDQYDAQEAGVSVGWGKKETQFHGTAGKAAAQQKPDFRNRCLAPHDDRLPRIAWRGDGAYFVCSLLEPVDEAYRTLRVFSREGDLLNTSEPINCLESPLAWKPSGNLIATSEQLPHRKNIIFWERNGLRHGEFALRIPEGTDVVSLQWSTDSTLLAVVLEQGGNRYVQVWMDKNYHWYLAQHIPTFAPQDPIRAVFWDPEDAGLLHIASTYTQHRLRLTPEAHFGYSDALDSQSVACVIDGAQLKVTPFALANVPPPMSRLTATLTHPARAVATTRQDLSLPSVAHLPGPGPRLRLNQIVYPRSGTVLALGRDVSCHRDVLLRASVPPTPESAVVWTEYPLGNSAAAGPPLRLIGAQGRDAVFLQTTRGFIYPVSYAAPGPLAVTWSDPLCRLDRPCPWLTVIPRPFPDSATTAGLRVIAPPASTGNTSDWLLVGRSERGELFLNDQLVVKGATSSFVGRHFIMFTTHTHSLRLLPVGLPLAHLIALAQQNKSELDPLSERRIERGARLVFALNGSQTAVVLEMPRGNLETIHPRALVLASMRAAVDAQDYRRAFELGRQHRIDLNVLVDHKPLQFDRCLPEVISQIDDPDYLNLFVSSLRDENVSVSMYPPVPIVLRAEPPKAASAAVSGKRRRLCGRIQALLEERPDAHRYLPTIITASVCKNPTSLTEAILVLHHLRETHPDELEDTLKYLLFLTDVEKVYHAALAVYDLPLALQVAQQSQKDPKEYLAFLTELQNYDAAYRRFKINDYLGQPAEALVHLITAAQALAGDASSRAGLFQEVQDYVVAHQLYQPALSAYRADPERRAVLCDLYAQHLSAERLHAEAGSVFLRAGNRFEAMKSYQRAGQWRTALALSTTVPNFSKRAIYELATDTAQRLADRQKYREAAQIYLEYTPETETAINLLVKGREWWEGMRIARQRNREDLLETHLEPGLMTALEELEEEAATLVDQWTKQWERLGEIRRPADPATHPTDDPAAGLGGGDLDNIDVLSEASTQITRFTQYTGVPSQYTSGSLRSGKTARSRRKKEKNKLRGKRGSPFEEQYVMESVGRLVDKVAKTFLPDVRQLSQVLPLLLASSERTPGTTNDSCTRAAALVDRV